MLKWRPVDLEVVWLSGVTVAVAGACGVRSDVGVRGAVAAPVMWRERCWTAVAVRVSWRRRRGPKSRGPAMVVIKLLRGFVEDVR